MTLSSLISRPCTIIRRVSSSDVDEYGNEEPDEETVETVCEAQPTRIAEPAAGDEVSDEDWTGFFLPGDATTLTTADAVWVDGLGTFEIVGRPPTLRNPRTGIDAFVQVRLRRTAGAETGS